MFQKYRERPVRDFRLTNMVHEFVKYYLVCVCVQVSVSEASIGTDLPKPESKHQPDLYMLDFTHFAAIT